MLSHCRWPSPEANYFEIFGILILIRRRTENHSGIWDDFPDTLWGIIHLRKLNREFHKSTKSWEFVRIFFDKIRIVCTFKNYYVIAIKRTKNCLRICDDFPGTLRIIHLRKIFRKFGECFKENPKMLLYIYDEFPENLWIRKQFRKFRKCDEPKNCLKLCDDFLENLQILIIFEKYFENFEISIRTQKCSGYISDDFRQI